MGFTTVRALLTAAEGRRLSIQTSRIRSASGCCFMQAALAALISTLRPLHGSTAALPKRRSTLAGATWHPASAGWPEAWAHVISMS